MFFLLFYQLWHCTLGKASFHFLPVKSRCCRHYYKVISGDVSFEQQSESLSSFVFCLPASPALQYLAYWLFYSRVRTVKIMMSASEVSRVERIPPGHHSGTIVTDLSSPRKPETMWCNKSSWIDFLYSILHFIDIHNLRILVNP